MPIEKLIMPLAILLIFGCIVWIIWWWLFRTTETLTIHEIGQEYGRLKTLKFILIFIGIALSVIVALSLLN